MSLSLISQHESHVKSYSYEGVGYLYVHKVGISVASYFHASISVLSLYFSPRPRKMYTHIHINTCMYTNSFQNFRFINNRNIINNNVFRCVCVVCSTVFAIVRFKVYYTIDSREVTQRYKTKTNKNKNWFRYGFACIPIQNVWETKIAYAVLFRMRRYRQ